MRSVSGSPMPYRSWVAFVSPERSTSAGRLGLHPEGQLERLDHALHPAVGLDPLEQPAVHPLDEVEPPPLHAGARLVIDQVLDRGLLAGRHVHRRPLMGRRQEAGAIGPHVAIGVDRDEARQVLVLGPQPVAEPRAHRRPHIDRDSGVKLERGRGMGLVVGVHGPEQAEVVGHTRQVRHQVRDHHAGVAAGANRGDRSQRQVLVHADRDLVAVDRRADLLAVLPRDQRLGIEQVELRRTSLHEQEDHAPGAGRSAADGRERATGRSGEPAHHPLKGQGAEATRGGPQ